MVKCGWYGCTKEAIGKSKHDIPLCDEHQREEQNSLAENRLVTKDEKYNLPMKDKMKCCFKDCNKTVIPAESSPHPIGSKVLLFSYYGFMVALPLCDKHFEEYQISDNTDKIDTEKSIKAWRISHRKQIKEPGKKESNKNPLKQCD